MQLSFSIDVILGSCNNNKKQEEIKRCSIHKTCRKEESQHSSADQRFTVKWKPRRLPSLHQHSNEENSFGNLVPPSSSSISHLQANIYRQQDSKTINYFFPNTINIATGFNYFNTPFEKNDSAANSSSHLPCDVNTKSYSYTPFSSLMMKAARSNRHSPAKPPNCPSKSIHQLDTNQKHDLSKKKTSRNRVGRRLFTGFQILELENAFASRAYLSRTERASLAQKVNLTECQIKTWFQNRRTKEKRRGSVPEVEEIGTCNSPLTNEPCQAKSVKIPGHGIQVRPTYGPPDKYLKAAIVEHMKRTSGHLLSAK